MDLLSSSRSPASYGADASVPVVVQYVVVNKLHSTCMHISSYMKVLDKQSEE